MEEIYYYISRINTAHV